MLHFPPAINLSDCAAGAIRQHRSFPQSPGNLRGSRPTLWYVEGSLRQIDAVATWRLPRANRSPPSQGSPIIAPYAPAAPAPTCAPPAPHPLPSLVDVREIQRNYVLAFVILHALAALVFVPWLFSWSGVIAFWIGVVIFGQLGIPVCYHRQLAHRSFKTPKWLERTFVMLALCSAQDTPAKWVAWHRKHHGHSDEQEDPHTPLVNFYWSHIGWLCVKNRSLTTMSFYQKYARDILEDPFYMYLERHWLAIAWIYLAHAAIYFLVAWLIALAVLGATAAATQMALSLLVWGVFARSVYVWHITWSVNSLTHIFGYRNFDTDDNSRNNWFVALITGGEGWHNNHHADQAAASVQSRWWEFDLNYYIIKSLEWAGLAKQVVPLQHKRRAAAAPTAELSEIVRCHPK